MRVLAAVLTLICATALAAQRDVRFTSASLDCAMPYRVLLPDGYGTGKRYPVLYLLHGLDGHFDNWTARTRIAEHASKYALIVVMPEGANSWYVNWHDGPGGRWEDYLTRDLIADVDARFETIAARDARFIAGLSMGGYGAMRMGLKHPDLYGFAASLSGAFNVTRLETYGWSDLVRADFARAFGPMGSERRRVDDLFALASRVEARGLPALYFDIGTDDPFLPGNRELAEILRSRTIPHEYRELAGAHNWTYWDRQIVDVLERIAARLR